MAVPKPPMFPEALRVQMDACVAKFPEGKACSALLMVLTCVQKHYGWLKDEHLDQVAEFLGVSRTRVYEVVSFYSLYKRKAEGKYVLKVCNSISCYLRGSGKLLKDLSQTLGVEVGQTTQNGLFTLKETECIAACCNAPCLLVNDTDYRKDMDNEKVAKLLEELKQKAQQEEGCA